jgi:release factor glutamine methyltransferase
LKFALAELRAARVPSHTLAAELLLMRVLRRDRAWLHAHPEDPLPAADALRYAELVARRCNGEPTQYLTGRQEFWGLEFEVAPGVLIPRPETEHLIEVALARLGHARAQQALRVADVGTGSGILAVALARELPQARVTATDISPAALALARRNAEKHGVAERIEFLECNLLTGFAREPQGAGATRRAFDLIVSNPPYIPTGALAGLPREVREHEPMAALDGGPRGDALYPPLITQARNLLAPGGMLVLEVGYNGVSLVRPLLDDLRHWGGVQVTSDLAGFPRVLAAARI